MLHLGDKFFSANKRYTLNQLFISTLSIIASLTYLIGLYRPFYYSEKFFIQTESVTLLESIQLMYETEEYYLAAIIFIFTVAFPVAKNVMLLWLSIIPSGREFSKMIPVFKVFSRWSMLDVFIVAVLLVNLNLDSGLYKMQVMDGLIYFSVSVILSTLAFWRIDAKTEYQSNNSKV